MISSIEARKIFHNYAIPIIGTVIFIVIFIAVWLLHQSALASVSNLAKSNPLIASGSNKLVSRDKAASSETGGIDNATGTDDSAKPSDTSAKSGNPTSSGGVSTATGQQPTTGSSGASTSPSSPQAPFAVSLGAVQYSRTTSNVLTGLLGIVLGCSVDHQFKISVNGMNGPGTIKYQWVRSTGGGGDVEQKSFSSGDSTVELVHKWTTSSSGDYWVNLQVSAPVAMEKKYSFKHQC